LKSEKEELQKGKEEAHLCSMKTSYGEKKDEKRKIKAEARRLEKREDKSFIFLNKWVLVSRRIIAGFTILLIYLSKLLSFFELTFFVYHFSWKKLHR